MMKPGSRGAVVVCAVVVAVAALWELGGAHETAPKPTPTPAACARPNLAASVVHAVRGVVSPMAEQQGLFGSVDVVVSLDPDSRIAGTRIQRSPSAVLNQSALAAARASSFQTEIKDCRPVASDFLYTVDFPEKITYATSPTGARSISVHVDATVTRAPDVAYVEARIATYDERAAGALAINDAIFDALEAKLRTLGITARKIRATRSVHGIPSPVPFETPPPLPGQGYGYEAERQIAVRVDSVAEAANAAAAAASIRSVDVLGIRYALNDHASAYREARDIALKDAETSANRNLTPRGLRLGPVLRIDTPPNDDALPTEYVRFYRTLNGTQASTLGPPVLQVHASAVVTYAIAP